VSAVADPGARPEQAAAAAPAGETVLLVEDNAQVRNVTARRLHNLGYRVVEAVDARGAIEHLSSGKQIDLVFSDVVMPGGMTGFDLARWAAKNAPAVRVLLTSGFAEDVARTGESPAPELEVLRKPYTGAELARALRRTLGHG
jgi:CheY-like chemotaxis protein